jgi:microcystin-dependent protein
MEAYMSMITPYGCNFVIRSWGACAGGLISISQMSALFSLLGTAFGGDGRTSFGLPDLRGRAAIGFGTPLAAAQPACAGPARGSGRRHAEQPAIAVS